MNEQVLRLLDNMAEISRFFSISPEYQAAVDELREGIARYEDLCGVYTSVEKAEAAIASLGKEASKVEKLKVDNQKLKDAAQAALDDAVHTVERRVTDTLKERRDQLDIDQEELEALLVSAKASQKEAKELTGKLSTAHDKREKELHDKSVDLTKREDALAMAKNALEQEKAKLTAAKERLSELV